MIKKALITGVLGQDGAYLANFLLSKGYCVYGGVNHSSLEKTQRLQALGIQDKISYIPFDLTDSLNIEAVINEGQFDEIYNLAAKSVVVASWDQPVQISKVNALGTIYLLDSINRFSKQSRFYQASTSEMFGLTQENVRTEKTPFYPTTPYAVAKLFAHNMTANYRETFGIHASSGILFNHESPLRGAEFVTKKITTQLAEIVLGRRTRIELGNLNSKKDWGYAKEYVVGMWKMLQQEQPDDYILATGQSHTVRNFVEHAASELDLDIEWEGEGLREIGINRKNNKILVSVNPDYYRPEEVDVKIANAKKAAEKLDWNASTNVRELAKIMVEFDLNRLKLL